MAMSRIWVETVSPSGTKWMLDMKWLLSGYQCIWGRGCQGTHHSRPGLSGDNAGVSGCCGNGVTVGKEDRKRVRRLAKKLTVDEWQAKGKYRRLFDPRRERGTQTRMQTHPDATKSGGVFLNFSDFDYPGCALHVGAMNRGENYWDWKPEACVTVPFHINWDDTMEAWLLNLIVKDEDWSDLDYWCGTDPAAYAHDTPTFRSMSEELENAVDNTDKGAWEAIAAVCEEWWAKTPSAAGHPVSINPRKKAKV